MSQLPTGFVLDGEQQATPKLPAGFVVDDRPNSGMDFLKSIPHALVSGLAATSSIVDPSSPIPIADELMTRQPEQVKAAEALTGPLYQPQTSLGRIGHAGVEALANPISWAGPGSALLKGGGALLSGVGSETGRQLAAGTPFEIPAQIGGAFLGGATAVKALGPKQLTAAAPTSAELRAVKDKGYQAARDADLVLDPSGPAAWAGQVEHELTNGPKYAFTGGSNGTAPKTLEALAEARAVPAAAAGERATVTGANLDTLRIKLGVIAGETKDFKPTPDAKAAMVAKRRLTEYTENIPQDHVLAGNAPAYGLETKTANANNAAFRRTSDLEQKLTNATDATEGSIAAKIDNQIKSKLRSGYLTNEKKQRGLTQDEVAAIRATNSGSFVENKLRQFGRLAPEGAVGVGLHLATGLPAAFATGGASVLPHLALALAASGAKHTAQHITKSNADKLVQKLAMRSPEYKQRAALIDLLNALSPTAPTNAAQVTRGILGNF